jgi:hypothetical protein
MSVSKDGTLRNLGNDIAKVREPKVDASPKSRSKKEGTRVGVLIDWRGSGKGHGDAGRQNRRRDGS